MGWFWKKHKIRNTCLHRYVKRNKLLLNFQIPVLLVRAVGLPFTSCSWAFRKGGYYDDICHLHSSIWSSNSKAFTTWCGSCGQRGLENPPATVCEASRWWWSDAPEAGARTKASFSTPANHPRIQGWVASSSQHMARVWPTHCWVSGQKWMVFIKHTWFLPCNFCPNLVPSFIYSSWTVLNYLSGVKMRM